MYDILRTHYGITHYITHELTKISIYVVLSREKVCLYQLKPILETHKRFVWAEIIGCIEAYDIFTLTILGVHTRIESTSQVCSKTNG